MSVEQFKKVGRIDVDDEKSDWVVSVVVKEGNKEIETACFGPLRKVEAEGFARMFQNMERAVGTPKDQRAMLCIKQLSNPWMFGIDEDLRQKLYGFSN